MTIYTIPEIGKKPLDKKVTTWNRKAVKLGLEKLHIKYGEPHIHTERGESINLIDFELVGEMPHFNGWEFVSKIDHSLGNPIILTSPNAVLPVKYHSYGSVCEHCNSNRKRNTTYAIVKDGEYKIVGSTCVKDFFDVDVSAIVSSFYNLLHDIEVLVNDSELYDNSPRLVGVEYVFGLAFDTIDKCGFVSKANHDYYKPSTSCLIESNIQDCIKTTHKSNEHTTAAIKWVDSLPNESEFTTNLKSLVESGYIPSKYIGFIAAGANSYLKYIEKPIVATSGYVGEPKCKIETTATLISKQVICGRFFSELNKFHDIDGHELVWFASNVSDFEIGSTYKIKATIKSHKIFNGIEQTIITRVKEIL